MQKPPSLHRGARDEVVEPLVRVAVVRRAEQHRARAWRPGPIGAAGARPRRGPSRHSATPLHLQRTAIGGRRWQCGMPVPPASRDRKSAPGEALPYGEFTIILGLAPVEFGLSDGLRGALGRVRAFQNWGWAVLSGAEQSRTALTCPARSTPSAAQRSPGRGRRARPLAQHTACVALLKVTDSLRPASARRPAGSRSPRPAPRSPPAPTTADIDAVIIS